MIDLFIVWWVIVLAIGLGVLYRRRTQPIAITLFGVYTVIALGGRRDHEPFWGNALSRNKKILIGVGVLAILGAIAYANFRFKRTEGVTVNTEAIKKRNLEAIVSASGKIQPKRSVNISADTMGRVTDLAVNEGDRVNKGQFLLQIDPKNLASAFNQRKRPLRRRVRQMEQLRVSSDSAKASLKQAQDNFTRQQQLWKGGLTTKKRSTAPRVRSRCGRPRQMPPIARSRRSGFGCSRRGVAREREVQPEQSPHRIPDQRDRHAPQHRGGRNRRDRNDEQRRHGAAHDCRHVGHRSGSRGGRDRHPDRALRTGGKSHDRRNARSDVHREGHGDRQQPHPDDRTGLSHQATNFKVIVTLDTEIAEVRPGFTCTAEITTATRKDVSPCRSRRRPSGKWWYNEKGDIVHEPDTGKKGAPGARVPCRLRAQAGRDAERDRGRLRHEGWQGHLHAGEDRHRGRQVLRGHDWPEGGRQRHHRSVRSVRELADGAAVKIEQPTTRTPGRRNNSQRSRSSMNKFFESSGSR